MITRRGWALLTGSLALGAAGRIFGVLELFTLAAGGVGLIGVAVVAVLLRRRIALDARRRLRPARVHAGDDSRVELAVRNRGGGRSPVVTLRDAVVAVRPAPRPGSRPRQARFHLAPLDPGASDRAAYRLGAEGRGVFRVGPLLASVTDPFGLVSLTRQIAPATELTVFPRVEAVAPVPQTSGSDLRTGTGHPSFVGSGDEFFALRAYEMGDDLRRVHWPSTARRDELMIRQHEMPWQGRATVLLDVRAAAHTPASFEAAVSAAASLVAANWHRDSAVRLLTSAGMDSGFGSGPAHLSAVMEHLAVVEPGDEALDALAGAARRHRPGALAVVTTTAPVPPVERLAGRSGAAGWMAVVLIGDGGGSRAVPPGAVPVPVGAGRPFADAWNRAMALGAVAAGGLR